MRKPLQGFRAAHEAHCIDVGKTFCLSPRFPSTRKRKLHIVTQDKGNPSVPQGIPPGDDTSGRFSHVVHAQMSGVHFRVVH